MVDHKALEPTSKWEPAPSDTRGTTTCAREARRRFIDRHPVIKQQLQSHAGLGVVIAALDAGNSLVGLRWIEASPLETRAVILGRHRRCGLVPALGGSTVALRHAMVLIRAIADHEIRVRVLDLRGRSGDADASAHVLRDGLSPALFTQLGKLRLALFALRLDGELQQHSAEGSWPATDAETADAADPTSSLATLKLSSTEPLGGRPNPADCSQGSVVGRLVASGSGEPIEHEVRAGDLARGIFVGRSARCDVRIGADSPTVSQLHAVIIQEGDQVLAVDAGSTHGTWKELTEVSVIALGDGDVLQFGKNREMSFRWSVPERTPGVYKLLDELELSLLIAPDVPRPTVDPAPESISHEGIVIDSYCVHELLGRGAMARVYRASHRVLEREYAIKVLFGKAARDARCIERLKREAQLLSKLNHPNLLQVFDCGRTPCGAPFVMMELLRGKTLKEVLRGGQRLPARRVVNIATQVATGLAEAHRHGLVHRDLKPSNIMLLEVDGSERAKILDFGIARAIQPDSEQQRLTMTNMLLGTPRYMAPEQIRAAKLAGPRSDLYSLGVVMYAMLEGHPPFVGPMHQVLHAHLQLPPAPLPPCGGLEQIVHALLAKKPDDRPASAEEVIAALGALAFLDPAEVAGLRFASELREGIPP